MLKPSTLNSPVLGSEWFQHCLLFSLKAKRGVCGRIVDLYESSHHNTVQCCPSLNSLLGLYMSSKFSSSRMKLSIYWAYLIMLQACGPVVMARISSYQLNIKSNCHRTRNPVQIRKILRTCLGKKLSCINEHSQNAIHSAGLCGRRDLPSHQRK